MTGDVYARELARRVDSLLAGEDTSGGQSMYLIPGSSIRSRCPSCAVMWSAAWQDHCWICGGRGFS